MTDKIKIPIKSEGSPTLFKTSLVKRENWNGKYVFVARSKNGSLLTHRKVKGSKLTLNQASQIFNTRGTFNPNSPIIERLISKNFIRKTVLSEKAPKVKLEKLQARMSVKFRGKTIYASSSRIGTQGLQTKQDAIDQALDNLFARIGGESGEGYDVDIGKEVYGKNMSDITLSWVYYTPK